MSSLYIIAGGVMLLGVGLAGVAYASTGVRRSNLLATLTTQTSPSGASANPPSIPSLTGLVTPSVKVEDLGGGIAKLAETNLPTPTNTAQVKLRYFSPSEFQGQYDLMDKNLLLKLDEFRHRWGKPVMISPVKGAVARFNGADDTSQHNADRHGHTNAVDVFPSGMNSEATRRRAFEIAKSVGFTGIGLYTDTKPSNMLHLDVRDGRVAGFPATWSRVNRKYGDIDVLV